MAASMARKTVLTGLIVGLALATMTGGVSSTVQATTTANYSSEAQTATQALWNDYWDSANNVFNNDFPLTVAQPGQSGYQWDYWWQANALYALADAADSTNATTYNTDIANLYNGIQSENNAVYGNNQFLDNYNDDEGWMGIAFMHAYHALGTAPASTQAFPVAPVLDAGQTKGTIPFVQSAETLFSDVMKSWTPEGGITWNKPGAGSSYNPFYRNTAANMTAAILGADLYEATQHQSYLAVAEQLYNWEWNTLALSSAQTVGGTSYPAGTVFDGVDWSAATDQNTFPSGGTAQWTYNYGLVIGAGVKLYLATHDVSYLNDAELAASAAINRFGGSNLVMTGGSQGDGGLFKGILMRYMVELAKVDGGNATLFNFLQSNLQSLWSNDQATNDAGVFGPDWAGPAPTVSSSNPIDLSTELSAVMALNDMATLQLAAQNFPSTASTLSPQGISVYGAMSAAMTNTNGGVSSPYVFYLQNGGTYEPDNGNIGGWGGSAGNEYVAWPVYADAAGTFTLTVRFSNGNGSASTRTLYVNGQDAATLSFPQTASWDAWSTVQETVTLSAGMNDIALEVPATSGSNWLNVSQITVQ